MIDTVARAVSTVCNAIARNMCGVALPIVRAVTWDGGWSRSCFDFGFSTPECMATNFKRNANSRDISLTQYCVTRLRTTHAILRATQRTAPQAVGLGPTVRTGGLLPSTPWRATTSWRQHPRVAQPCDAYLGRANAIKRCMRGWADAILSRADAIKRSSNAILRRMLRNFASHRSRNDFRPVFAFANSALLAREISSLERHRIGIRYCEL